MSKILKLAFALTLFASSFTGSIVIAANPTGVAEQKAKPTASPIAPKNPTAKVTAKKSSTLALYAKKGAALAGAAILFWHLKDYLIDAKGITSDILRQNDTFDMLSRAAGYTCDVATFGILLKKLGEYVLSKPSSSTSEQPTPLAKKASTPTKKSTLGTVAKKTLAVAGACYLGYRLGYGLGYGLYGRAEFYRFLNNRGRSPIKSLYAVLPGKETLMHYAATGYSLKALLSYIRS